MVKVEDITMDRSPEVGESPAILCTIRLDDKRVCAAIHSMTLL